jgi:cyclase
MYRSLIVAKITPGSEEEVARVFAESDATELPRLAGVAHRSLFSLGDLYAHLIETDCDGPRALENIRGHEEFRRISDRLGQYVQPYLPTWRTPLDSLARCFYTYEPPSPPETKVPAAARRRGEVA